MEHIPFSDSVPHPHMRQPPLIHVEHDHVHLHYNGKDLTNFVFVKDLVFTSQSLLFGIMIFFISFIKVPEKIHVLTVIKNYTGF